MPLPRIAPEGTVGLTTTVPLEILHAAGRKALDLNNHFVADPDAEGLVAFAERRGFPAGTCAWIKGLYAAAHKLGIREVVGVVEGDCAETGILLEIWASEGIRIHPFAFPASGSVPDVARELRRFGERFGVTPEQVAAAKTRLDAVRAVMAEGYALSAGGDTASGELFSALLSLSDLGGDLEATEAALRRRIGEWRTVVRRGEGLGGRVPLACIGVPTILTDLWDVFEEAGGRFLDFEVPRQFALMDGIGQTMEASYAAYTYPASTGRRIADMLPVIRDRGIRGVVHYVQSFCHRQLGDRLWRERLPCPVLTLEADRPGRVDERTRTRIEAFMEQLL